MVKFIEIPHTTFPWEDFGIPICDVYTFAIEEL